MRWPSPKHFGKEFTLIIESILSWLPGIIGRELRRMYYSKKMKCGKKLSIAQFVEISGYEGIQIGENCSIGRLSVLHAHGNGSLKIGNNFSMNSNSQLGASEVGKITIGDDVIIAQNVVLRASDHQHADTSKPIRYQGHTGGTIIVNNGVWIGANAVITRNVTIGANSIIAAGSVVTRDIPPFVLAGGVPAKTLKHRAKAKNF